MPNINGGRNSGQAGAIRLGITRALMKYDEQFRPTLSNVGFITSDAREVGRKLVYTRHVSDHNIQSIRASLIVLVLS